MTFASQSLKKTSTYCDHVDEQIVVTKVVIDSKKEKVKEDEEKKTIIDKQITAFKKTQELNQKIEEVKQWKSTINK